MNGQEDWDTWKDSGSVSGRHEAINGEYHFVPENRHADFTDAHYEPADESTVPPRYYTPPEKTAREPRKAAAREMPELPVWSWHRQCWAALPARR